ncbi:MAG TPA: hypothetical protein VM639_01410 [Dongiaceae bacterium]|nr:hypothetical protein [Dongiaceae bacterium]
MPASAAAIFNGDEATLGEVPRRGRMTAGIAASIVLHLCVLLLIAAGLLRPAELPAPADLAIPVDLVRFGPVTAGPVVKRLADLPQEQAPRAPQQAQQPPHPAPLTVQPPAPAPTPVVSVAPAPVPSAPPAAQRALAALMTRPQAKPPAQKLEAHDKTATPLDSRRQAAPPDPLTMRLQQLAKLKLGSTPAQPGTGDPAASGLSNATAASADAAPGLSASYSVKDFLRAQVIRHWNLKTQPSQTAGWTVSIHLQLRRDGSVALVEIVDPARYRLNRPYFEFALSARNAVLLAAPLVIPPGQYDLASDVVLPFSARDVVQ